MLLHIDSKQEVKWETVLFPPDIDYIIYCSACTFADLQNMLNSLISCPLVCDSFLTLSLHQTDTKNCLGQFR